jgi:hypothetical protein
VNGGPVQGPSSSATLTVITPATFSKTVGTSSLQVAGTTNITYSITNPAANPTNLTNLAFTDTLPPIIQAIGGAAGSCGGGTINVTANLVSLTGATLSPGANCSFSINVKGVTPGTVSYSTSSLTNSQAAFSPGVNMIVSVVDPPTITQTFDESFIDLSALGTTLTFTITNPNAVTLDSISFSDNLPACLKLGLPDGGFTNCLGASIRAPAGGAGIELSNLTLAAKTSCTLAVEVLGAAASSIENGTNTTSPITAFGGSVTGASASATITVQNLVQGFFIQ